MTDGDFGPTGIDPDWYDNGPGSENWKIKRRREQMKWDAEIHERRLRERRIIEAAEALVALIEREGFDSLTTYPCPDWKPKERCGPMPLCKAAELVVLRNAFRAKGE